MQREIVQREIDEVQREIDEVLAVPKELLLSDGAPYSAARVGSDQLDRVMRQLNNAIMKMYVHFFNVEEDKKRLQVDDEGYKIIGKGW